MKKQDNELEEAIDRYSGMLYKTCFLILKNEHDSKDVLQETFLAYYTKSPAFESEEHRKAWLFKVSQNKCREFLRFHKRHAAIPLEEMEEALMLTDGMDGEERGLLSMIWNLSYKYKAVVILYYLEGYSIGETAGILGMSVPAVKKRLQRVREKLRAEYEGEVAYE